MTDVLLAELSQESDASSCQPEKQTGWSHQFKIGDRVRLSPLGKARNPRTVPTGQIVSIASRKSGFGSVYVLLDGLKSPTRLHWTYLERIDHSAGGGLDIETKRVVAPSDV